MFIAIAGGKEQSDFLISVLLAKKHKLVVINADFEYCEFLSKKYETTIIHGNPARMRTLNDAEISGFDVLIALTEKDSDNLAICQWGKAYLNIRKVVCTVGNPKNVNVFKQLGVNTVISSTYMVADYIAKSSTVENLIQSLSIENEQMLIYEVMISTEHPFAGKIIKDIKLPAGVIIGCIFRSTRLIVPNGLSEIQTGDRLLVLTTLPEDQIPKTIAG